MRTFRPREKGGKLTLYRSSQIEAQKVRQAIGMIRPVDDLKSLPTKPCARNAILLALATAGGVFGISTVAGRGMRRASAWSAIGFTFVATTTHYTCMQSLKAERQRMKVIIERYQSGGPQEKGKGSVSRISDR